MTVKPLTEEDFESIESAVLETARGRWFLAEYARRQRATETEGVIAAIERLEAGLTRRPSLDTGLRGEVAKIAKMVGQAHGDVLTAFGVQTSKGPAASRADAAQRAALTLNQLEIHLRTLVGEAPESRTPATAVAPALAEQPLPPQEKEDAENPASAVPDADQAAPAPTSVENDEAVPAATQDATDSAGASGEPDDEGEVEQELFGEEGKPKTTDTAVLERAIASQPDNHEALATTLRAAIASVRGPASDIDALSFEAKSVLFA